MSEEKNPPKRTRHLRNWLTYAGAVVALGSFFAFLLLFAIDLFSRTSNPYLGILAYVIAPGFLFLGLGMAALGAWFRHRSEKKSGVANGHGFLSIDFSRTEDRKKLRIFVVGSLIQIVGIVISKPLADRFGKKAVFITGVAVTTMATAMVYVAGPASIGFMFFTSILWALGWGPTVPLLWVMIADVADYSEWKTSRRATGFMYAGILFALKAGLSLGGALSAWIINAYGYVPNVAQTERALLGIRLGASVYPATALLLGLVCLAIYPIGKQLGHTIEKELNERRREYMPEMLSTSSAQGA